MEQVSQNVTFRDTWKCDAIYILTTSPHVDSMVQKWKFLNRVIKTWKCVGLYTGNTILPHGLVYCDLTGTRDKIFLEEGVMWMFGALTKKKRGMMFQILMSWLGHLAKPTCG